METRLKEYERARVIYKHAQPQDNEVNIFTARRPQVLDNPSSRVSSPSSPPQPQGVLYTPPRYT
ncbi:hypothetical protein H0H92_015762 [Tricholoma furcatifolium]|nr:hypothetical protein H0H92_015762 [Tricholoma furcatifolium]